MNRLIKYFRHSHLREPLKEISALVGDTAIAIDAALPESAEKTAGLRKMLEAKDCFVRAKLDAIEEQETASMPAPTGSGI